VRRQISGEAFTFFFEGFFAAPSVAVVSFEAPAFAAFFAAVSAGAFFAAFFAAAALFGFASSSPSRPSPSPPSSAPPSSRPSSLRHLHLL